jgi:HlyD family secretion protein
MPLAGLGLALGSLGLAGCRRGGEAAAQQAQANRPQEQGTVVQVTRARRGPIENIAEVTGSLTSLRDVTIGAKAAGKIVAVYGREGDLARAGQTLVQQDRADLQAQLDQQVANLVAAQTRLKQARVTYQNAQTTLKWTDEQTRSALQQAEAALKIAQEQASVVEEGARPQELQQAKENVAAAKADLDKAQADLKRYRELYREGALAAQQLDQAEAIADTAQSRYRSAQQALSLLQEGSREQDRRRAQASVEQARQALLAAQSNRRQVQLRRDDVENARVGIQTAEATMRQAQAAVRLAEQALHDTSIVSPIDGVIAERKVEPGTQVGAGKDVMRIVSLRDIFFDALLSETQFAQVRVGQPVRVTVDALPGRTFQGRVSKIFPVASATARSFTARISIRNEGDLLRPQAFARGQIVLDRHPNALLVPRLAVLDVQNGEGKLFVAKEGKAEERLVKLGFITLQDVEILSGLQEDEAVLTAGQSQVQNGDKIQVQGGNRSEAIPVQARKSDT